MSQFRISLIGLMKVKKIISKKIIIDWLNDSDSKVI